MNNTDFPDDADGQAIRRIAEAGSDLTKPMDVDIQIMASRKNDANNAELRLLSNDFSVRKYFHEDTQDWDVVGTKSLVLTYTDIIRLQQEVANFLSGLDCVVDGWGSSGNV